MTTARTSTLGYPITYVGLGLTIQFVKQRFVKPESQQRNLANRTH